MSDQMQTLKSAYSDIINDFNADGIRITVERAISFTNSAINYGLRIERERQTSSGRQGKPTPIIYLVNNPDESPSQMLRTLADVLDQDMNIELQSKPDK